MGYYKPQGKLKNLLKSYITFKLNKTNECIFPNNYNSENSLERLFLILNWILISFWEKKTE